MSLYEALMGLGKGKEVKKLKVCFGMRVNAVNWQKYTCAAAHMVSNQWSMWFQRAFPWHKMRKSIQLASGDHSLKLSVVVRDWTCALWNSSKPESLQIPYSALLGLLFLGWSCIMSEACAATECAVLLWRVVWDLYIQTEMNYDKHQINVVMQL